MGMREHKDSWYPGQTALAFLGRAIRGPFVDRRHGPRVKRGVTSFFLSQGL